MLLILLVLLQGLNLRLILNALDDKIDKVEQKIPDISGLATKSSVTRLITEQEDYTDKVKKKSS